MQRFVGGIGHHESKRLYGQFASSANFISSTIKCEYNGIQNRYVIQNLFMLKSMKFVSLCILLNESYCLCYLVMHACIKF